MELRNLTLENQINLEEECKEHGGEDIFNLENVSIWNQLAEFLGFGIYNKEIFGNFNPNPVPIYTFEKIEFTTQLEFEKKVAKKQIKNWRPNFNLNQAELCEKRLVELGGYDKKTANSKNGFDWYDDFKLIIYSGPNYQAIKGIGKKHKAKAICDACLNFMDKYPTLFD